MRRKATGEIKPFGISEHDGLRFCSSSSNGTETVVRMEFPLLVQQVNAVQSLSCAGLPKGWSAAELAELRRGVRADDRQFVMVNRWASDDDLDGLLATPNQETARIASKRIMAKVLNMSEETVETYSHKK